MANKTRKRRIIYNEDGDTIAGYRKNFHEAPMALDDYLRELFEPLIGTQVDTYVWCYGAVHGLTDDLGIGGSWEYVRSIRGKFDNLYTWRAWTNLKSYLDSGNDPPQFIAKAAHDCGMEMFLSLRMNDAHDANGPDIYSGKIKKEHPEWLMGDPGATYEEKSIPWWMRKAFNYAVEEVRSFVISIVEKMLSFDNEGVELDFMSHPFLFKLGQEKEQAPLLTDMVRKVKRLAAEKDKLLMLHVPATIARCEKIGIDVKTWIREGLVDLLSFGRCVTPVGLPTGEWMKAVSGTECQVYASLNTNHSSKHARIEALRAFAMQHLSEGAHGIYLFNFFLQPFSRGYKEYFDIDRYDLGALNEIGDLKTLSKRDKLYLFDHYRKTTPNAYGHAIPFELLDLPLELEDDGQHGTVRFKIYDKLDGSAPQEIALRMEVANLSELDTLGLTLNGGTLIGERRTYSYQYGADIEFPLPAAALKTGANELEITVQKRNPYIEPALVFEKAEVSIRYR